jgi:hypothetical protein
LGSERACWEYLVQRVSLCRTDNKTANATSYNRDICQDLDKQGVVAGNFKVFYQNIQGIFTNKSNIMKLLDSSVFDIIALNETHTVSVPLDVQTHAKRCGYNLLELPGRKFANAGRFVGGSLVFIRKNFQIS